jgi:hypothetical protein
VAHFTPPPHAAQFISRPFRGRLAANAVFRAHGLCVPDQLHLAARRPSRLLKKSCGV